jgi:hypothetical protein
MKAHSHFTARHLQPYQQLVSHLAAQSLGHHDPIIAANLGAQRIR